MRRRAESTRCSRATSTFAPDPSHGSKCHHSGPNDTDVPGAPHVIPSASDTDIPGTLLSFRAQARNLRAGLQPPDSSADLGMTDAGNDRGRMTHAVDDTCTEPGAGLLSFRARRHRHSRRSPCHSERKRHGHSGHPTVIPSASEESPRQSPTPRFLGGPRNDRSRDN